MKQFYNLLEKFSPTLICLVVLFAFFIAKQSFAGGVAYADITNGTTYTLVEMDGSSGDWEVPCGVTSVTIELWGGGGAGGGDSDNGSTTAAGGGASGGYQTYTFNVVPGEEITISVGAGATSNGGSGGDSQVTAGAGTFIALGGNGGLSDGTGGTAVAGGNAGSNSSGEDGGAGGDAPGGGAGGPGGTDAAGTDGTAPGGGGGGGSLTGGGGTANGGNGGDGGFTVSWSSASAGVDQALATCGLVVDLDAADVPANTIGTWTVNPDPGITFNPSENDPDAQATGLQQDQSYVFTWTVSDNGVAGGCTTSSDELVVLTRGPEAEAGPGQSLCVTGAGAFTMAANTPEATFTGAWTVVSGNVTINAGDVNDPLAPINSTMVAGECATLQWSVTGACSNTDQVTICYPYLCNDDPCGADDAAYVLPLNGSCTGSTFVGAITNQVTETVNPDRPGCALFGQFDDATDVWYSVGPVPADGIINFEVTLTGNGGNPNGQAAAAVYTTGAGCHDLIQESCHAAPGNGGTAVISESGLTPGSTVYIRVWDNDDYPVLGPWSQDVTICAYTSTNDGDIVPGDNNITCGTTYSFYDSGGSTGNYSNNQQETYTICPSVEDPQEFVSVTFTGMNMASSLDHMIVLNGSQGAAQLIGDFYFGTPTYTSTAPDGCLTFIFQSSTSNVSSGWAATVSCVVDDPANDDNHLTGTCSEQNCLGGCLRTLCGIPATVGFQGDGPGNQELNETNNSCWTAPERCSNWFYINPTSAGDLSLNMYVNNGQDQDYLLWEAFGDELQCPAETGAEPLLCNYAGASPAGTGFNDALVGVYSAYEPSLQISPDDITNGLYYIINVQTYSNGASCPQPDVQITFGGSAGLGCNTPVILGLDIVYFDGFNEDRRNILFWDVEDDKDVAYYILEKSKDASNWGYLGTEYALNTTTGHRYQFIDEDPLSPFTYYRVRQVDYDGTVEVSQIISVSKGEIDENWISMLFPNPTSDAFSFQYQGNNFKDDMDVVIYDKLGRAVFSDTFVTSQNKGVTINTSNFGVGMYRVVVSQGNKTEIKKLSILR